MADVEIHDDDERVEDAFSRASVFAGECDDDDLYVGVPLLTNKLNLCP